MSPTIRRIFGGLCCQFWAGTTLLSLSMAILRPAAAIGGEQSLTCIYDLMTGAREGRQLCGEPLDPDAEARYDELRSALKAFINANIGNGTPRLEAQRITPDYDEKQRQYLIELKRRAPVCEHPEYQVAKDWLSRVLQEQQSAIRKRLEAPGDPTEGDCL